MRIPTLQEIVQSVSSHMQSELELNFIGRTFLYPFIIVLSGIIKIIYLYAASVQKNIFVDTADSEDVGGTLERFARIKLNRERLPATQGEYSFDVVITADGTTIPAGTTWKIPNGDYVYILDDTVIADIGTETILIRALASGTESTLDVGQELEITQPIIGVNPIGEIESISQPPIDAETLEQYRGKAIQAYQAEPTGGSGADYRLWALDVPEVKTVFSYVKQSVAGTLQVYVENVAPESTPNVPTLPVDATLDALYLEEVTGERTGVFVLDPDTTKDLLDRGRLPVGIFSVEMLKIIPIDIDIEITNLIVPGSGAAEVQQRITDALLLFTYNIRPFVSGADDPNTKSDTLRQTDISAEVIKVLNDGETVDSIELKEATVVFQTRLFTFGDVPNINILFL